AGTLWGQGTIGLGNVPEQLVLPAPDGVNHVLDVSIAGGMATSVWLAAVRDDQASSPPLKLTRIDANKYRINLAGREVYDYLKQFEARGQFRVFAETDGQDVAQSIAVRYSIGPARGRLFYRWDDFRVPIYQRTRMKLPCLRGTLRVQLEDITRGQVLVSVYGLGGTVIASPTSMKEGDELAISACGVDYILRLDKLVNLLIGEDYGVFSFMPINRRDARKIEDLLEMIAASDVMFIRQEREYSGKTFAAHLRQKRQHFRPRDGTLSEFIDSVASRSVANGEPYSVKLSTGKTIAAADWLNQQASQLGSPSRTVHGEASSPSTPD
ncbi:MAG: DUF5329 family protein, partial [Planctomycetes bacterium]|nr:DUF5329 family protein [Planctomycetota bacterium]